MMDSPDLRKLKRAQLQSLAKREQVRAIGPSEEIICRLLKKHPDGVPIPEDDNPSASSAPQKRIFLKISLKGQSSLALRSPRNYADQKGKGKADPEVAPTSPSSSTESLQLLYPDDYTPDANSEHAPALHSEVPETEVQPDRPGPSGKQSTPPPGQPSLQGRDEAEPKNPSDAQREASDQGWRADGEHEADEANDIDYPKGAPNHYMVVDALRKFTPLVNAIPFMETRISESHCLLLRTESTLDKAMPDVRELVVTREYLEVFLLGKMKQKPELWDGTAKMEKADRKLRMEWLRAERRAENEKKWKEINALFEEKGHKPLPFSAFASQSDEEVIESLETTPESSSSGSPKRPREESVDGDSDGYSDTDGESRRKRARL